MLVDMERIKNRSKCPISFALDIFGDKWSLLIIRDLVFTDKKTYGEFLKSDEGIATNILASRLHALTDTKIISKIPNPADGRKELFSLTEKGFDLVPILMEMMLWSAKHDPDTIASKEFIAQARKIELALGRKIKKDISLG
jgi:DNA-binding HxlR family transcriptional regulator